MFTMTLSSLFKGLHFFCSLRPLSKYPVCIRQPPALPAATSDRSVGSIFQLQQ